MPIPRPPVLILPANLPVASSRPVVFIRAILGRFRADDGFRLSASLAYTTILSIVPLVAVGLGIFTAFPGFDHVTATIQEFFATQLLPKAVADRVLGYIDEFARNAGKLTAVGLAVIALTAIVLVRTIERAFNQIWRVRRERPIVLRLLIYWALVTLGPVVVGVSLSASSFAMSRWLGLVAGSPLATVRAVEVVPWLLVAVGLAVLYVIMPARRVRWIHALAGGVFAATSFEVVERLFGMYVAQIASYTTVYGTLAVVPIFLLWIYLSWVVVILGAEMVALLPDYGRLRVDDAGARGWRFPDVLRVLVPLVEAQRAGRPLELAAIAGRAGVPSELVEPVLERLAAAGWVARLSGERWTLLCNADVVTVGDVYARLQMPHERGADSHDAPAVERMIAQLERAVAGVATPLATLAPAAPVAAPGPADAAGQSIESKATT